MSEFHVPSFEELVEEQRALGDNPLTVQAVADQLHTSIEGPRCKAEELRIAALTVREARDITDQLLIADTPLELKIRYRTPNKHGMRDYKKGWCNASGWEMLDVQNEPLDRLVLGKTSGIFLARKTSNVKGRLTLFRGVQIYRDEGRGLLIDKRKWPDLNPFLVRAGLAQLAIRHGIV